MTVIAPTLVVGAALLYEVVTNGLELVLKTPKLVLVVALPEGTELLNECTELVTTPTLVYVVALLRTEELVTWGTEIVTT